MKDFNYYAPTEVVFGKESEEQVAQLVKKYGGTKVLVHYGGKSAERSRRVSTSFWLWVAVVSSTRQSALPMVYPLKATYGTSIWARQSPNPCCP